MNELLQKSFNTPTMSSREIATLCDKEHRNVLADIRTMCEQLNLDVLKSQDIYLDSMNLEYDKLSLPKVGETPYTHEQNGQTPTADDRYDEKLYGLTIRPR